MARSLIVRAPQSRCYRCGSPKVQSVCHHCGQPICAKHTPRVLGPRGRPLSAEFTGLNLVGTRCGEGAVHCSRCRHVRGSLRRLVAAGALVAVAVAGLAVLLQRHTLRLGLPAATLGLGLVAGGAILSRLRTRPAGRARPPLPLLARFDPVQVRETLQARITLRPDGDYRTKAETATGHLTIAANLGKPERERVQLYRRKYKLGRQGEAGFHLGFALLKGAAALEFEGGYGAHDAAVLPLTGQVHGLPFLDGTSQHVSGRWSRELRYKVGEAAVGRRLPISLTPSLVQAAGRRSLDLDLQWDELVSKEGAARTIDRVESLELRVPLAWGRVRQVNRNAVLGTSPPTGAGEPALQKITWLREAISDRDREQRRRTFEVQFDNQIDLQGVVRGRVEVSFTGALSGLRGVDLYYPLGGKRSYERATVRTHVIADFELSLAGVRYQDVRFVPDPEQRPSDADKKETVAFEGVVPDHTTIIALTNAISEQGYYVKRVLENPPRTGGRANLVNRYWDIAGRIYRGVYPVDFHLVVTGEEVYDGSIRAQAGTTKTTLTVQGAYATADMEARVEGTWEQLSYLIRETLGQQPRVASAEEARQWQSSAERQAPSRDGRARRVDVLRQLREQIDEELGALLEGD